MNLVKKIAVGLATLSVAAGLYAVPVLGATSATNSNISDDSFADVEAYDIDTVYVATANSESDLFNLDVSLASTGLNTQNGNEDGNSLSASDAQADYSTANFLNVNEASGNDGAVASNTNITDGSDGDALADDSDTVTVYNSNYDTFAFNLTASIANTGLNTQNKNEDGNDLIAGSAWSYAEASNVVNHNKVTVGNGTGATATNTSITGDSFADAEATNHDEVSVNNSNNKTTLFNVTASVSNSGLNTQNGNEDGNTIQTGNVGAGTVVSNYVNVNQTTVGGNNATASNSNISGGSDGDAKAVSSTRLTVTNNNNGTTVGNVSVAVSNSGGNTQKNNEDGNSITTGSALATGQTINVVNGNQVSF